MCGAAGELCVSVCVWPLFLSSYVLHIGAVESGTLSVGDSVSVEVDYERRADVAPNHTMTHALNFALRKVRIVPGSLCRWPLML